MEITKSQLKKWIDIDGADQTEVIDLRIQAQIEPRDTYEAMRAELHSQVDRRFNLLFRTELGLMPDRVAEGDHWKQHGLFEFS